MESSNQPLVFLPAALLAEVEAMAALEHRTARDVLREAVEKYLHDRYLVTRRPPAAHARTPQEAAKRMLEMRKGNVLPEGVTIRDLMTHGRA